MAGERYNEEFKVAAVKQVIEGGYSIVLYKSECTALKPLLNASEQNRVYLTKGLDF